nr:PREDICTED: acyl-CoA-binding domain-containing protein 5 [Lepisosteus oculatus]
MMTLSLSSVGKDTFRASSVIMADEKPIHEQRFDAAVKVIQSLPQNGKCFDFCFITRDYLQITSGYWGSMRDAWKSLGSMSKDEAMTAYVEEMKKILETMPMTEKVEELLRVLGPFYEIVEDKKMITQVSDLTSARLEKFARSLEGKCVLVWSVPSSLVSGSHSVKGVSDQRKTTEGASGKENVLRADMEHDVPSAVKEIDGQKTPLSAEDSEEKLTGTTQKLESNQHHRVNGHLQDHSEDVSSLHHLPSDSDSEVYCDSMEQFGQEENPEVLVNLSLETGEWSHAPFLARTEPVLGGEPQRGCLQEGAEGVRHGGEDGKDGGNPPQRDRLSAERSDTSGPRKGRGFRLPAAGGGAQGGLQGGGGDGERWGTDSNTRSSLNEQIAATLNKLQEDMQSVLQRLHTLEALAASQARSLSLQANYPPPPVNKKPSWWPFDISPGTLALAVVWPFIVQWLVRRYLQRRRRKH